MIDLAPKFFLKKIVVMVKMESIKIKPTNVDLVFNINKANTPTNKLTTPIILPVDLLFKI